MDDAGAVGMIHCVTDLAGEVEGLGQVERSLACGGGLERLAWHELHHDEEHVVDPFGRQHGHDVGMIQAGEQSRFLDHLAEVEVLLVGDLDGHLLVDPGVFGKVDATESAAAERGHDAVLSDGLAPEKHAQSIAALIATLANGWAIAIG